MNTGLFSRALFALLALGMLSACGIDTEAGLCTYMGACNEDPEEKKEAADKKWWCEYYSGKNCGEDAGSAPASTQKDSGGGMDHSASGQDDN